MRLIRVSTLREYASVLSRLLASAEQLTDIPVIAPAKAGMLHDLASALGVPIAEANAGDAPDDDPEPTSTGALRLQADHVRRRARPPARGRILARAGDELWPGLALAVATQRRLLVFDDWAEAYAQIVGSTDGTTLICPHDALLPPVLAELARLTSRHDLGVVTGRDLPAVSFAVAKAVLYNDVLFDRSIVLVPSPDMAGGSVRHRRVALAEIDDALIQQLMVEPCDFFGISTHGDNIDSAFGRSILCGLTGSDGVTGRRHVQTCEVDGLCRRDVNNRVSRLPFRRLRARFMAIETCSGIGGAQSIFPVALSQAMAAVDGWADGFLSSIKVARDTAVGPLLVLAALMSGKSYGEASRLYSSLHVAVTGDKPSYLLLGDAEGRLVPHDRVPSVDAIWPEGALRTEVALDDTPAGLTMIRIRGAPAAGTDKVIRPTLSTLDKDGNELPVFAALIGDPGDGCLLVLVFASGALPALRLRLALVESTARALQQKIFRLERNLTQLRWIEDKAERVEGLRPTPQLRTQAADLKAASMRGQQALLLLREMSITVPQIATCNEIDPDVETLRTARKIIRRTERDLVNAIPHWQLPHHIAPFYDGYLDVEGPERAIGSCEYCNSPLYEYMLVGRLRPDIARTIAHCQRCAVISDRPADAPRVTLIGDDSASPGERISQRVALTDGATLRWPMTATLVCESVPWFEAEALPQIARGTLGASPGNAISFTLDVHHRTRPGVYYMMLCSISDLGVSVSSKPLRVNAAA